MSRQLTVREAVERWLNSIRPQRSEETVSAYWYRLKLFIEWTEKNNDVRMVRDLDGWVLDEYENSRRSVTSNLNTLKGELTTLRNWLEYCERIEVVDEGLAERVEVPSVPKAERASNKKLATDDAAALLDYYRNEPGMRGCRQHALLEILWHTAARIGEVHALDLDDLQETPGGERQYLTFRNRPESGTRLKKGVDGERPVLLSETVWDVLQEYVAQYRHEITDDHGREPLITSNQGRASKPALRTWTYRATIPCHHSPCPHGREKQTCEYTEHNSESGCPSSRSPHQIRSGAITWMRNRGLSEEVVAGRVNASIETIRDHYDVADPMEEMLERRASDTQSLDITQEDDTNGN